MDIGGLLRTARQGAQLSQGELARRAGTSRGQVSRIESGRVSPTVAALQELLSHCGKQLRASLEPLMADVDARVDALLGGEVVVREPELAALVLTLEDHPDASYPMFLGKPPARAGQVTWAFDAHTALQLQGLAAAGEAAAVVLVLDEAARFWLRAIGARLMGRSGQALHWLDGAAEELAEAAREPFFTLSGMVQLRIVEALPATVVLAPAWSPLPVPVATREAVEDGVPHLAELLARMRARRSLAA
ncbi:MAG: helix-turn-helix domain-containing protein [Mycobacteriales bacterium]